MWFVVKCENGVGEDVDRTERCAAVKAAVQHEPCGEFCGGFVGMVRGGRTVLGVGGGGGVGVGSGKEGGWAGGAWHGWPYVLN